MAMRCSPGDGLVQRTVRQILLLVGTGFWVRVGVVPELLKIYRGIRLSYVQAFFFPWI